MTRDEAIAVLRRMLAVKRVLADAPRTSGLSRDVGRKHQREADALAVALAEMDPPHPGIPTSQQQREQGARCGCMGSDDLCPCQNVVQR
jgi:hypothetical protein